MIAFSDTSLGGSKLALLSSGPLCKTPQNEIHSPVAFPIIGTFANLPDGSIFAFGRNNYQASYCGGDGNDLTLTVAA
jgi:hypothetical protein